VPTPADNADNGDNADNAELISATEAARRLGVKESTIYAYVSRGRVTRHRREGSPRSWFDPTEIAVLAGRRGGHAGLELAVATSMTDIDGRRLRYRGVDLLDLAGDVAFERIVELLWTGAMVPIPCTVPAEVVSASRQASALLGRGARWTDRLAVAVAAAGAADPFRSDLAPGSVMAAGRRILAAMVDGLPAPDGRPEGTGEGDVPEGQMGPGPASLARRLWCRLHPAPGVMPDRAVVALNGCMVVLADHELATSTLAARVAASARADPYSVVASALGVFAGPLHGAASEEVVRLLVEASSAPGGATQALADRLRLGRPIPGFGHRLYPEGDPRAPLMLAQLDRLAGGDGDDSSDGDDSATSLVAERLETVHAVLAGMAGRSAPPPNADFGLGAFVFVTGMSLDAGEAIFAISRTAGWIGHALEEYQQTPLRFRSRAVYTGMRPVS